MSAGAPRRGSVAARTCALGVFSCLTSLSVVDCRRDKAVRIHALATESTVLPRVHRQASADVRTSVHRLDVGGHARKYVAVEPAHVDPSRRYALVLVIHGDGGNAEGFHEAFPFERASGTDAVLAYLDGIGRTWDLETTHDNRDVRFAEAVIDELAARLPIDRARLFATGYSSGGFFANVLACQKSSLVRAIASNAGGAPYNQPERWANGYPKCPGQAPVAALALHGDRDMGVTLDSGRFSAAYWAYVNGCQTDEMESTGYPACHAYRGCPAGKAAVFCDVPGLGHWVWDEAAEASWTFFERQ